MATFVNLYQTKEERQEKYHLARSLGVNSHLANRMKDWRLSKIERLFHLCFNEHYRNAPVFKPYAQFLLPGFTINPHGPPTSAGEPLQSNSSTPPPFT